MGMTRTDGGQVVYDPRGVVESEARTMAPRPRALRGLRLAVLDNTKWNAGALLRHLGAELQREHGFAAVNVYKKESFSLAATPALLARIAAHNDIALTAVGD
ncbi:MAG TPA: hypothetical protein VGC20_05410 [bacterium]